MTTPSDEHPTIRESTIPDTRRGEAQPPVVTEFIEPTINGPDFHEYRLVRQFPAAGGEADIWLVLKDREYFILKHYRLGIEPKSEVLQKVSNISQSSPKNLVRILSYGYDEETKRWFEIQEYARNGSLKDLMNGHQIGRAQFRTIISEISAALDVLHRNNILHLDLKPSNVLVRNINPLNLILIDFGISTLLDTELSRQITSTKGTPMYWAPEQLGNVVGKEADYWALGVIALEITLERHPFSGMNHNVILSTLSTRGITVPDEIQPKTALLLKGLLTRNPRKRWGKTEVDAWLAGRQNIPVHYEQEHRPGGEEARPYEFRSEEFFNLNDLSYAFIRDPESWEDAKRHLGRGYINRWLEKCELYGQAVELEKFAELYQNEDERLLYSAARFNPDIPFTLYGIPLDIGHIVLYLSRYLKHANDDTEKKVISMLFSGDLHRIYQTFTSITGHQDENSLISLMFTWLNANTRGIDEKKRLYEYLKVLKEREEIGPPQEWDAKTVLKLVEIRNLFLKQGYDDDSTRCEEDVGIACRQALISEPIEPDLLVALASVSEEMGLREYVTPCLKRALEADIRVVSLLYNRKNGLLRFNLYRRLRKEYETNLYSLSANPWGETPQFWKDLFSILLSGGNFVQALSVSERVIELDRMNAEGWVMRGVSLARIGRVKEADFFLSAKITQSSKSPLVWQIFGEYYEGIKQQDDAEKSYKTALEIDPGHTGSLFGLIRLYSAKKRYQDVISLCDAALKADNADQAILLKKGDAEFALGRIGDAVQTYEEYLTHVPTNSGVLKCLARCQIKLKKISEAEQSLDILLSQGEADAQVYRLKAYLLLVAGKVREAIGFLDKTLESEPGDTWTLRIKADAHIALREYAPALACIDQVLGLDPKNHLMAEKKGKILLSLGFCQEAATFLLQAADGGRISADLCLLCGDAIRNLEYTRYGTRPRGESPGEQGLYRWRVNHQYADLWAVHELNSDTISRLTKALGWYDQALTRGADEAAVKNRKSIVFSILKDFPQARMLAETAVSERKSEPAYLTNLAVIHVLSGDTDKGAALFLQGMSRFSTNAYFLDQCAGLYYIGKQDADTALDMCTQAIQHNSNRDPIILYHKMRILQRSGMGREADEVARQIRQIDPWFELGEEGE